MFVQSEPSSQNLVSVATDGEIASRMRVFLTGERINTYFFAGVQSGQFTSVGFPTLETSPPPSIGHAFDVQLWFSTRPPCRAAGGLELA